MDILLEKDVDIEFVGDFLVSGKQVGKILKYSKPNDAITNNVDEEDSYLVKNSDTIVSGFRKLNNRGETFINESGLYGFIFSLSEIRLLSY